jgi:hypothetical protein
MQGKRLEIERGRVALDAAGSVGIWGGREFAEPVSQLLGGGSQLCPFGLVRCFTRGAVDQPALVLNFAGHDVPNEPQRKNRVVGGPMLRPPEQHRTLWHAFDASEELALLGEEGHGHVVLPTKLHGRRRHGARSENEHGLEVMDGKGKLELAVLLDAQREVVPVHVESLREQVECVLDDLPHLGNLKSQI